MAKKIDYSFIQCSKHAIVHMFTYIKKITFFGQNWKGPLLGIPLIRSIRSHGHFRIYMYYTFINKRNRRKLCVFVAWVIFFIALKKKKHLLISYYHIIIASIICVLLRRESTVWSVRKSRYIRERKKVHRGGRSRGTIGDTVWKSPKRIHSVG